MTAAEFAQAHGDSSTWSAADIETEINLAEIDAHCPAPQPTQPAQTAA